MTTPTSGAADLPEAPRSIQRFEVVDCIDDKHVPAVIPNSTGPWVRYEDHAAELLRLHAYCQELESQVILDCMTHVQNPAEIEHFADDVSKNGAGLDMSTQHARITEIESQLAQRFDAAPAQPVAQQGAAYAALPEYGINTASHAHFRVLGFTADQMRAFADATHTLRASHGQAPAGAGEAAEHYRNAIASACEGWTMPDGLRKHLEAALWSPPTTSPQAAESVPAPVPPPECETEAEKRAFAFGWFKALESERMKADNKKKDPL